uniref:Uncharacterized protein n=1 Tax=Timema douglasi TaxID=61478 RepID=A0A7R8VM01_TIMDO|nr:unnamed protein product [Timema douglasi]
MLVTALTSTPQREVWRVRCSVCTLLFLYMGLFLQLGRGVEIGVMSDVCAPRHAHTLRLNSQRLLGIVLSSALLHLGLEEEIVEMALLSFRLATSVARHLPGTAPQLSNLTWPAAQVVSRKFHISCSRRAAEISSLLEERILGSAPKVAYQITLILKKN